MKPSKSLATKRRKGAKKDKEGITLALRSNADGSDRMPPLLIGEIANPRCFKNVKASNLGAHYRTSRKAWMNEIIFRHFMSLLAKEQEEGVFFNC